MNVTQKIDTILARPDLPEDAELRGQLTEVNNKLKAQMTQTEQLASSLISSAYINDPDKPSWVDTIKQAWVDLFNN